MLSLLTVKNFWVLLAIILLCNAFVAKNTIAEEEVVMFPSPQDSETDLSATEQSAGDSWNSDLNLLMRIESLERRINYINKQIGKNITVVNIAKEAKDLASDAWTLAVEARSIAVRAEEKADAALKNKSR